MTVTLISPGFVDSNIRRVDNQGSFHASAADPIRRWLAMRTDSAARQMLRAISNRIVARGGYRSERGASQ